MAILIRTLLAKVDQLQAELEQARAENERLREAINELAHTFLPSDELLTRFREQANPSGFYNVEMDMRRVEHLMEVIAACGYGRLR